MKEVEVDPRGCCSDLINTDKVNNKFKAASIDTCANLVSTNCLSAYSMSSLMISAYCGDQTNEYVFEKTF